MEELASGFRISGSGFVFLILRFSGTCVMVTYYIYQSIYKQQINTDRDTITVTCDVHVYIYISRIRAFVVR